MKTYKKQCGDWHLGWGFGGKDKVGTLSTQDGKTFIWKGHSLGRHGQKWNAGATVTFTLDDDFNMKELSRKGSIPMGRELLSSAKELIRTFKHRQP